MTEPTTSPEPNRWLLPAFLLLLALMVFAGAFALVRLQQAIADRIRPDTAEPVTDLAKAAPDGNLVDRLEVSAEELAAQEKEFRERVERLRREAGTDGQVPTVEQRDRFAEARLKMLRQINEARGDKERIAELMLQLEKQKSNR
jgi:hypothetical protein